MKEIKAIIQPFMFSNIISALNVWEDLPGVTVSEIKGFGKSRAEGVKEKIVEESISYVKNVTLEIVLPDRHVGDVIEVIYKNAHTGRPDGSKIFVSTVEEVMKISTGRMTYLHQTR